MAVPKKFVVVPNSATRELWRIAESDKIDELESVLPRADINARNEHGMTALMRAAHHGRLQMVRALLEHGADPNAARNDQFTALSLAAFFGHAEIVDLLMQRGAKTDVATRSGTSPHMWARARSFGDVARCLEKRNQQKQTVAPMQKPVAAPVVPPPVPSPPPAPPPQPIVVRTLKEPPEIWDLVQEAPRDFKAGSAFVARIGSSKASFLLRVAGLLIAVGLGTGAVLYLKDTISWSTAQPPVSAAASAPVDVPAAAAPAPAVPAPAENASVDPPKETNNVVPEASPSVVQEPVTVEVKRKVTPRTRSSSAQSRAVSVQSTAEAETVQTTAPPVVAPAIVESRSANNVEERKTPVPVNSQLVVPKSTQPKAKVIQWP